MTHTVTTPEGELKVGDSVTKVTGYPFGTGNAKVVGIYGEAEQRRYVVQQVGGWQQTFRREQLALAAAPQPPTPESTREGEALGLRIAERIHQEMTSGRQWWLDALSPAQREEYEADLASTCVAICEDECVTTPAPEPARDGEVAIPWPDEIDPESDLAEMLGRPNFACGSIAHIYQRAGANIPKKAEAEQAFVIHRMIRFQASHGDGWRDAFNDEINQLLHLAELIKGQQA